MIRIQAERTLLQECLLRLRQYPVIAIATPNGLHIPVHRPGDDRIKARILARMRADGMLLNGCPDLVLVWRNGGGLVELKRPAHRDIFGFHPAGQPSEDQKEFARRCGSLGVNHAYCRSWDDLRERLAEWGAITR